MSLRSDVQIGSPQCVIIPTPLLVVVRSFIGFAALLIGPFSQLV